MFLSIFSLQQKLIFFQHLYFLYLTQILTVLFQYYFFQYFYFHSVFVYFNKFEKRTINKNSRSGYLPEQLFLFNPFVFLNLFQISFSHCDPELSFSFSNLQELFQEVHHFLYIQVLVQD